MSRTDGVAKSVDSDAKVLAITRMKTASNLEQNMRLEKNLNTIGLYISLLGLNGSLARRGSWRT